MRVRLSAVLPRLDERARRAALAAEARAWGHGGVAAVHRASGAAATTIRRGLRELDEPVPSDGRVRAPGGGRKRAEVADAGLMPALDALIEPGTRGDPCSPLRWTTKSTRKLATELTAAGHPISHNAIADVLKAAGYSLQGTRKTLEGAQHPDRDAQFAHINTLAREFLDAGEPVISVDTKKKELIGAFAQPGRDWHPRGAGPRVSTYDFPHLADAKAIPYGVYDIGDDSAWVGVGIDHDTSVFAVATIEAWWNQMGKTRYPNATRLLITADGGGSNGHRPWLWKYELHRLAKATGLDITVAHYPPGTSKWNKVEHRLFSRITANWAGRPLETLQTVVALIANTTTTTGLVVRAELDPNNYPTGTKLTDEQKQSISITRHEFHGEWNYTIHPNPIE